VYPVQAILSKLIVILLHDVAYTNSPVAALILSRVTWALLKLLVMPHYDFLALVTQWAL